MITYLCWDQSWSMLTHWGRATHICVSKLTFIASGNGLSPGRRQAIIWNNAGILPIGLLGTNFSEILIEILTFSFKKIPLKLSSAKWRPFCLGLNVLIKGTPDALFTFWHHHGQWVKSLFFFPERSEKTVKIEASTVEIEERGVKLRLTVVDTPGFADAINNEEWWVVKLTNQYLSD